MSESGRKKGEEKTDEKSDQGAFEVDELTSEEAESVSGGTCAACGGACANAKCGGASPPIKSV